MEEELNSTIKFTEHIFDGSGNKIMNSIQYTAMSIVPLLMVNSVLETQLPGFSPNTPPLSMIIETAVHLIILLIVLYFVDRTVRYFPSATGDKYGDISFETIGLLLVLLVVNSQNTNLGKKVLHMTRHVKERFTNREGMKEGPSNNVTASKKVTIQEEDKEKINPLSDTNGQTNRETSGKSIGKCKSDESGEECFTQKNTIEPLNALESFAMTGGNYSPF